MVERKMCGFTAGAAAAPKNLVDEGLVLQGNVHRDAVGEFPSAAGTVACDPLGLWRCAVTFFARSPHRLTVQTGNVSADGILALSGVPVSGLATDMANATRFVRAIGATTFNALISPHRPPCRNRRRQCASMMLVLVAGTAETTAVVATVAPTTTSAGIAVETPALPQECADHRAALALGSKVVADLLLRPLDHGQHRAPRRLSPPELDCCRMASQRGSWTTPEAIE